MQTLTPRNLPRIIGHRGASREAPENTMEAFRLAWKQGAGGIEADFRLSADGRIVCIHDATTARTAGVALNVADTPLQELQRLNVGARKGADLSAVMMPTLDQVLAVLPPDSWFFIEIKCGPEIITQLKRVLLASGLPPQHIRLLSFSAALIAELKQQLPDWQACWVCDYRFSRLNNLWRPSRQEVLNTLQRCGADGLASANRAFLDRDMVEALKECCKEIHVWTVDRLPDAQRLRRLGVDSIMTNRPGWLLEKLTSGKNRP